MSQKIILTVPDEMHDALQQVSRDTDKVIAAIVRRAIAEHLAKEYNVQVDHNVQRGGDRRSENTEE